MLEKKTKNYESRKFFRRHALTRQKENCAKIPRQANPYINLYLSIKIVCYTAVKFNSAISQFKIDFQSKKLLIRAIFYSKY